MPRFKIAKHRGIEYKVTNDGGIILVNLFGRGKWLPLHRSIRGCYYGVNLHMGQGVIPCYMLVAIAYCDGKKPGYLPHHKDHNKLNDHYTNLEWVTKSDNARLWHEYYKEQKLKEEKNAAKSNKKVQRPKRRH